MDEGLAALSALLGDKRYLLGFQPCVADASVFGFLDKYVLPPWRPNPHLDDLRLPAHVWNFFLHHHPCLV
jgi:glutathione S-transferase